MPKVSIIIPCLNSVKYIREAMDSVVNQTLRDIEVLVVDAGSTDGTLEILREYAACDHRVKLLNSDKKSTGYQCNIGVKTSTGEYIGIVEADDYIEQHMYEELYTVAKAHDVDYVKSDFEMFADLPGERLFLRYSPLPPEDRGLYWSRINIKDCPELSHRDVNIWNGLYSRDFINRSQILSNETPGAAFQDIGFVMQTLLMAKRAVYVDYSHYRYRRDNMDSSVYNKNTTGFIMWEFEYALRYMQNIPSEVRRICEPLIYGRFFESFSSMLRNGSLHYDITSEEFIDRVTRFSELFKTIYKEIDFTAQSSVYSERLSRKLLLLNDEMLLFLNDTNQFCTNAKLLAEQSQKLLLDWVRHLRQQPDIVLFGAGEIGGSVCCYLRRNGIEVVGFCDNDQNRWDTSYMNRYIYSPEEIASKHPNAIYVISVADDRSPDIRSQLVNSGIKEEKVCNYISLISPHTSFELAVLPNSSLVTRG